MESRKYFRIKPNRIILPDGSQSRYSYSVDDVLVASSWDVTVTVVNGTASFTGSILEGGTATVTITPNEGYELPESVSVSGASYTYDSSTGEIVLSSATGNVSVSAECPSSSNVDPILDNNSWETIAQVCVAGEAADYWALGDTKTDVGTDGVTRTFRICDMYNAYTGRVVFEQVELTENGYIWNYASRKDDDNCYNNYDISNMRSTVLPARLAEYSLDLQAVITNTTYKVAKNGLGSSMTLDLTDKLFLPAEREIFDSRGYSVQSEWDALTRFALYALPENDNATFRKKYKPSTPTSANYYWERSPGSGTSYLTGVVNSDGGTNGSSAEGSSRIAPCFSLGPAPSVQTISFTIEGAAYQSEQNMTWAQWVESAYNTDGYHLSGEVIVNPDYTKRVRDQSSTDVIVANTAYTLAIYGG